MNLYQVIHILKDHIIVHSNCALFVILPMNVKNLFSIYSECAQDFVLTPFNRSKNK